ncbi:hypothetical protein N806_23820 [Rhodococcus sp. P27]|nr:hypothetical protein N806_23820 [Rhodococcus sp. P27]
MTEATSLAAAAGSPDPTEGLRAVRALRRLLEKLEAIQVANARRHGWSWQAIAEALEVSRQAVHKKYASAQSESMLRSLREKAGNCHVRKVLRTGSWRRSRCCRRIRSGHADGTSDRAAHI